MKLERPFESNKNKMRGPKIPPAPLPNLRGKSPNRKKGRRRRMDSIGARGAATGVIAVGAGTTFYPNVRSNKNLRPPLRRRAHLRIQDRLFLHHSGGLPAGQ